MKKNPNKKLAFVHKSKNQPLVVQKIKNHPAPWKIGEEFIFSIESLDNFGQGIYRHGDYVVFIPKTLPGEKGLASIQQIKKKVAFAKLISLSQHSLQRLSPQCPHFEQCRGCDYLHTDYQSEVEQKQKAARYYFREFITDANITLKQFPEILPINSAPPKEPSWPTVWQGPERFHQRNRLQLHYDLTSERLGMMSTLAQETQEQDLSKVNLPAIIKVPACKLAVPQISESLKKAYEDIKNIGLKKWLLQEITHKKSNAFSNTFVPETGHLEWQFDHEKNILSKAINEPYGHLGFSQVHSLLNNKLKERIHQELSKDKTEKPKTNLLDLFAGKGNLRPQVSSLNYLGIDLYHELPSEDFLHLDLFDLHKIKKLAENIILGKSKLGVIEELSIIVDPPRSGWLELTPFFEQISKKIKITSLIYVSCWPSTLRRDLQTLKQRMPWDDCHIELFDFFPGTKHFETMISLHWS